MSGMQRGFGLDLLGLGLDDNKSECLCDCCWAELWMEKVSTPPLELSPLTVAEEKSFSRAGCCGCSKCGARASESPQVIAGPELSYCRLCWRTRDSHFSAKGLTRLMASLRFKACLSMASLLLIRLLRKRR